MKYVSRVMSFSELDLYEKGVRMMPKNRKFVGHTNNESGKYPDLKASGCFFFLPQDAREFTCDQIQDLDLISCSGGGSVLAVFRLHDDAVCYPGNAIIHEHHDWTDYPRKIEELYIPTYSKRNADLVWCDRNWQDTVLYVYDLRELYSYAACNTCMASEYGECCSCDGVEIPAEYLFPYRKRARISF